MMKMNMRRILFSIVIMLAAVLATMLASTSCLWGATPNFKSISAYTSGTGASATGTISLTIAKGDFVGVTLVLNGTSTNQTCQDNNSNPYYLVNSNTSGTPFVFVLGILSPASATSISCTWTTNRNFSVYTWNYGNVGGFQAIPTNSNGTGASSPATTSPTSSIENDTMVCSMAVNALRTWSSNTGSLRSSTSPEAAPASALSDAGSGASVGSGITVAAGYSGAATTWNTACIELMPTSSAITYIGSAAPVTGSGANTTITYSPTAGNTVVIGVGTSTNSGAISGCLDNNFNLLLNPTLIVNNTGTLFVVYGTAITGATSYTCYWINSTLNIITIAEYSGVVSINSSPTNSTGSGASSTPATVSPIPTVAQDLMVGVFHSNTASGGWTAPGSAGGGGYINGIPVQIKSTASGAIAEVIGVSGATVLSSVPLNVGTTASAWEGLAIELSPNAAPSGVGLGHAIIF